MAANTNPIFSRRPDIGIGPATLGQTAVTALDGTGALQLVFQADPAEGSYVDRIILKPVGSPVATVVRVFICIDTGATFTSGTTNTANNTGLITEFSLPAITVSQTMAQNDYAIPIRMGLPAGTKLLIGFGTATGASASYSAVVVAGDY